MATWTSEQLLSEIMNGANEDKSIAMLKQGIPESIDIDHKISNRSVLNFACFKQRVETVRLLISLGADVESGNKYDERCVTAAAQGGNLEIVKMLVAAGANPDHRDQNGMKAIQYCQDPEIKGFLQFPM